MQKISAVVLAYSLNDDLDNLMHDCVKSLKGKVDELIIVDNGSPKIYDWMISESDKYVRLNKNVGYVKGMNAGAKNAVYDHIVFVTSDTKLISGDLRDLCNENICLPVITTDNSNYTPQLDGVFYAAPNDPFCLHDERFDFYFSDKDLFQRATENGIKVIRIPSVVIDHKGWETTTVEGKKSIRYEKDKKTFFEKWGFYPEGEE